MWDQRLTAKDIEALVARNLRRSPVEEVMRLRALQEFSEIPTELLLQLAFVISQLQKTGELDKHVRLYLDHVIADRRPDEPRSFVRAD